MKELSHHDEPNQQCHKTNVLLNETRRFNRPIPSMAMSPKLLPLSVTDDKPAQYHFSDLRQRHRHCPCSSDDYAATLHSPVKKHLCLALKGVRLKQSFIAADGGDLHSLDGAITVAVAGVRGRALDDTEKRNDPPMEVPGHRRL